MSIKWPVGYVECVYHCLVTVRTTIQKNHSKHYCTLDYTAAIQCSFSFNIYKHTDKSWRSLHTHGVKEQRQVRQMLFLRTCFMKDRILCWKDREDQEKNGNLVKKWSVFCTLFYDNNWFVFRLLVFLHSEENVLLKDKKCVRLVFPL